MFRGSRDDDDVDGLVANAQVIAAHERVIVH